MKPAKLTYQEIPVGLERSFNVVATREMVEGFSRLTGDLHPLHTDPEYARRCGYEGVIVQGMLTSAFASTLVGMHIPGERALVLSQSFRYLRPVYPGEELLIRGVVIEKINAFSALTIEIEITGSSGECVSRGTIRVKVRDEE